MGPVPEGYCSLAQLSAIQEGMGLGVALIDERHRIVSVSPLADTLLARKGLPPGSTLQRELLKDVFQRSYAKVESQTATRFILRRPGQLGALFFYVVKVDVWEPDGEVPSRYYVLLVRDPTLMLAGEAKILAEVFGLTRRESELACYLALGADLALFAKEKFVSLYTAKSHLKQIFRKMGVHRQSELVVKVLAVVM